MSDVIEELETPEEEVVRWKELPIIKRDDCTYVVMHNMNGADLPYHVNSKEADPAGIYDINEVAAVWNALSDDDSNKQTQADEDEQRADEAEIEELNRILGVN